MTGPNASARGRWLPLASFIMLLLVPYALAGQGEARRLTLEQTVRLALERDPAAVAAEAAIVTARADVLQTRGAWLPSVTATTFYNNSSNERFDQATGRLVSENYTGQLQGGYDLFAGGRRVTQGRAAGAELVAAEAMEVAQRFQTILAAKETFYAVAAAADLLHVAEQRLERARQQYDFAETRYEVGTVTTSDVLRAEIEVANAELAADQARVDLRATALQLGRVVGVAEEVHPSDPELPARAPALEPLETMVERAARVSPLVVAAEAVADSRRAQRLAAYTPYLPTIRLMGGYDWFAFDFPPDQRSWSLRVFASMPIFNGFQREAAVLRAGALERAAQMRARDARIQTRVAVETAVQGVGLAERRVAVADRTVALAREDLRVQEERYQIAAATILDLQASQVALAEAEVAAIRARQQLGSTLARLEAILGEQLGED